MFGNRFSGEADPIIFLHSKASKELSPKRFPENNSVSEKKLQIISVEPLISKNRIRYLERRGLDVAVAQKFCQEVKYSFGDKSFHAIGFKNDEGGYEIRGPFYKYSSAPKAVNFYKWLKQCRRF